MMGARILVSFACNHGEDGLWRGTVEAVSVHAPDGDGIDFEWSSGSAPRLTVLEDRFRFLRRLWAFDRRIPWYGNWCWDAFRVTVEDAADLLLAIRLSGKFCPDGGVVPLLEAYEAVQHDRQRMVHELTSMVAPSSKEAAA